MSFADKVSEVKEKVEASTSNIGEAAPAQL